MLPDRYMLMIDGWINDPETLASPSQLAGFLSRTAERAGMKVLNILTSDVGGTLGNGAEFVDEGGMSAQALISTSHITIHVWPDQFFVMFDLVSCKAFDLERIAQEVMGDLGIARVRRLVRGDDQAVTHAVEGGAVANLARGCISGGGREQARATG
jgi:S-adenosylmethionine/arginine decarboxylase-like enzyme